MNLIIIHLVSIINYWFQKNKNKWNSAIITQKFLSFNYYIIFNVLYLYNSAMTLILLKQSEKYGNGYCHRKLTTFAVYGYFFQKQLEICFSVSFYKFNFFPLWTLCQTLEKLHIEFNVVFIKYQYSIWNQIYFLL